MAESKLIARSSPFTSDAGRLINAAIRSAEDRMLAELLAARWLGHGRAVECYLALTAALAGLILLTYPNGTTRSAVIGDLSDYGRWIAIPLLLKALVTGSGLILNIRGRCCSRYLRMAGGFIGSVIWLWLVFKFSIEHAVVTVGFPFCCVAALFSIRIMGMAAANLPPPGAPGAL